MESIRPTYSFTIPSLHDLIELECRVFHPAVSSSEVFTPNLSRIALVGHAYAPLGGNYDSHVIATATKALLRGGYIVGTFNFRGAEGSHGRTSWTGRAELADYISLFGFMLCYLSHVRQNSANMQWNSMAEAQVEPQILSGPHRVICGGYSYGSIIARNVPPSDVVVNIFVDAPRDSIQEEINLRAQFLGQIHLQSSVSGSRPTETGSQEVKKSTEEGLHQYVLYNDDLEGVRRSMERFRDREKIQAPESTPNASSVNPWTKLREMPSLNTSYLLISPPVGLKVSFATAFLQLIFEPATPTAAHTSILTKESVDDRLVRCYSFAVWGKEDGLQGSGPLRKWAMHLESRQHARFQSREIPGAGHFWTETGVASELCLALENWLKYLDEISEETSELLDR